MSSAHRRSPWRWVFLYAMVVSVVGALVFGLLAGFTHKVLGSASMSPEAAAGYQVDAAAIELAVTPAVHFTGSFSSAAGDHLLLDAQVSNEGSMVATLTLAGEEAEFVATGDRRFVRASQDVWSALDASSADAGLYGGQWVQVDQDFLGVDLPVLLAPQRLAWAIADPDRELSTSAAGDVEEVNGVPARPIRSGDLTVWVSEDEPRRIVRIRSTADEQQSGDLVGRPSAEEDPGPDEDEDEVIEGPGAAGEGPDLPDLDLQVTEQAAEAAQELLENSVADRVRQLTESIDSRVSFSLNGAIVLAPCGPNGCTATVSLTNTVTSTSPYVTVSQPVNAQVTTNMTLDGAPVQTCASTVTMPPSGSASTQCSASYSVAPSRTPRTYVVRAEAVAIARAVVQADIDAMISDLTLELQRSQSFLGPDASPLVPGGGLQGHEIAGGHTLLTHLGRTDTDLVNRVQSPRAPRAASAWTDRGTAEATIAATLAANEGRIQTVAQLPEPE